MQIFTKYEADYQVACQKFQDERNRFEEDLNKIPFLRIIHSEANYFLCEVLPPFTSHELAVELLKEQNILIKDCSGKKAFNGRNFIRLAVRNATDNNKLINALTIIE
jgi:histidinol-phosphate/aromatic aminotransferase/cobyric acid decarboxylase-like protein